MMTQKDSLRILLDVAFNNNVDKIHKESFDKALDVQLGVYTGGDCEGWLTINLKPSHGWLDWIINLHAWKNGLGVHAGYWAEWLRYRDRFLALLDEEWARQARWKGCIIAGRSKGAAEAIIIAEEIFPLVRDWTNCLLVGAIEPPRVCDRDFRALLESHVPAENIICTRYHNDIVPGVPPWLILPGSHVQLGRRTHGLSWRDHVTATTDEAVMYAAVEDM